MTLDTARTTDLTVWQERAAEWTDTRIDGDTLEWRGLVLGEETGEVVEAAVQLAIASARVQRALLKAQQDIRGGTEHWLGELRKETGDAFFCLAALAHRAGFSLADAVNDRWADLSQRTYATLREEPTAHDCGHSCCDERSDPHHDHFLGPGDCPACINRTP